MVDNAQLADGQDLLGQPDPPAQNLLGQEQLGQKVDRPYTLLQPLPTY